ncbi:MAG: response regulator [Bacteroidia bacterium]
MLNRWLKYQILFVLIMVLGVAALGQKSPVVIIDSLRNQIEISPETHLWYAYDSTAEAEANYYINHPEVFKPIGDHKHYINGHAYWFSFHVESQLEHASEWMLYLNAPGFADVYIQQPDGSFLLRQAGKYVPYDDRDVTEGRSYKVRLELDPQESSLILVKIREVDGTGFAPNFRLTEMAYWKTLSDESQHVIVAAFGGVLMIIMLYNLILFVVTRQFAHLYYALYLLSNGIFVLYASQTLSLVPSNHPKYLTFFGFVSLGLISIFYFQFGRSFVDTKRVIPKWDKWLFRYILLKIFILCCEIFILLFDFDLLAVNKIEFGVIILDAIVAIILIIRLFRTDSALSRFFIAGSTCVIIFAFGTAIVNNFITIENSFMYYLGAVIVEILIFSLGLGYKIKTAEKSKLRSQEALNRQLLEADKLKDEFLANTSHELRTPLNGIIGLAESLKAGVGGPLSEKTQHDLGMIVSSGRRLGSLVNDLLDFSKLKNFELELRRRPVDLRALVDVVLEVSKPLLEGKDIELVNAVPVDLQAANADENRLQQILYNLVGNGIKFTDEGEVAVHAIANGDMLEIRVSDTGPGIPADRQSRIFESFEQGDGSVARQYGGTGLGLSITRQLVNLHGGRIWLESEEGVGSNFYFTLPSSEIAAGESRPTSFADLEQVSKAVQKSESAAKTEQPLSVELQPLDTPSVMPSLVNGRTIRILVVDDEPINQQVLKNQLSLQSYQVVSAMNGAEALKLLDAGGKFDLVLLDIMMPKMSGYEVCREIRKRFLPSELPVIMITAKNQVSDLVEGLDMGANDYLTKPFSKDEILARIKTHLGLLRINAAYGRFVPHEFLRALGHETILDVKLGDQVEKDVTVFFSDIRAYTTLSETMTPQENFNFMNAYLGRVGPIIQENRGFVNQYYGDGVMALFLNNPEDAISAGVGMHRAVRNYNEYRAGLGRKPIKIGIGLHNGPLMLGIIGDSVRMEAGVVSDTVNTAARMEGLTKYFSSSLIVSDETVDKLTNPEVFRFRFLGKVLVKGKHHPVDIYDFYDGDDPVIADKKEATRHDFETGTKAFFGQDFGLAVDAFERVLAYYPEDKAAQNYLIKSKFNVENPVPESWTGVEEMHRK